MRKLVFSSTLICILIAFQILSPYEIKIVKKSSNLISVPKDYGYAIISPKDRGYAPIIALDTVCWVRALCKLNRIKFVKDITHAKMIVGKKDSIGHAWIQYIKNGKEVIYDPTTDRYIKEYLE